MTLRVDSSSTSAKVVFGIAAIAVVGVGTALFLRSRGNAAAAPAAPSLAQKDVSIFRNIPFIGNRIANFLNPTKKAEPVTFSVGSPTAPITSQEDLIRTFADTMPSLAIDAPSSEAPKYKEISSLVIYGEDLQITQDPGFLALRPSKLILVGTSIIVDAGDNLDSAMRGQRWHIETSGNSVGIKVASVDAAAQAPQHFNPSTGKHIPTVYRVTA